MMKIWPFRKKAKRLESTADVVTFLVHRNVKAHYQAGKAFFESKKYDEAIQEYQSALRIDPNCALVHFNIGFVQHEKRDYISAKRSYHRAVELDPGCPLFLEHLGKLYYETEEYSQAILFFEKAADLGAIQPVSYGILGKAFLARKEYRKSIEALEKMLQKEKSPSLQLFGRYYICIAQVDLGNLVEARRLAQGILDEPYPVDVQILRELGSHFLNASCITMAEDLYKKACDDSEVEDERLLEALEEIDDVQLRIDEVLPQVFCGDEEVVLQNIHLLNEFGSAKVSKALISIVDARSPLIREAVVEYNRRFGFPVWREVLPLLEDEKEFVREKAAQFLSGFDEPGVSAAMREALFDESSSVRLSAARQIKRVGNFEAVPALTEALSSEWDPEVREAFLEATSNIKARQQTMHAHRRRCGEPRLTGLELSSMAGLASMRTRNLILAAILAALIAIFFVALRGA